MRYVSHEIRTPLNTTLMGLRLLDQQLSDPTNQDEALMLDLIDDCTNSCLVAVDILNDLLLYEKIDGGLLQLELNEIKAWPSICEVLKSFKIQVRFSYSNKL